MAKSIVQTNVRFPSSDIQLEGVLHAPASRGPHAAVVVCHPHPRYGGDMDNPVVVVVCLALARRGIATLRFNFRGVGQSQGQYSGGDGEVTDARAALAFLGSSDDINGSRVGIAGYSFGASIALEAAAQQPLARAVATIACPAPSLGEGELHPMNKPKLFVTGDLDHAVPLDQFNLLVQRFAEPKKVHVISGADHFLRGQENVVATAVVDFFGRHLLE